MTLDGGWVYDAGLTPNNLKPVAAEFYGSIEREFSQSTKEGCHGLVDVNPLFIGRYQILDTSKQFLWGVRGE